MFYWSLSIVLVLFGILGLASIGQPFLLLGVTLLALGSRRHRPRVFWPPLLAVIAFNLGYWATVPFSCIATSSADGNSSVVCTSLVGLSYQGVGNYNPPLAPALAFALVLASLTFIIAFVLLRRGPRLSSGAHAGKDPDSARVSSTDIET